MSYQDELHTRLAQAHALAPKEEAKTLNTNTLEDHLVQEIEAEFELGQYDLDESDILRSIKILDILSKYADAFEHHKALSILYALAKTDFIQVKNLHRLSKLNTKEFKLLLQKMSKQKILRVNEDKEIELTIEGQSLAERIGFNVFI